MQLIPRYLVSNRSLITANEAGFITEYRPVYNRQVQLYRGIDNVLEFKLLNADQKPISLTGYTPKLQVFDENNSLIIEHDGEQVVKGGNNIKGVFKVTVTENDLLNVKDQFLKYTIYLVDANGNNVITYANSHFENIGTIKVNSSSHPAPRNSVSITSLVQDSATSWISDAINAEPGINGNEALHTAVVYSDGFIGDVVVQVTLDNQISGPNSNDWADVATLTFTGSETEPKPVNFNGVFSYLRFKTTDDPANKISKILVRN